MRMRGPTSTYELEAIIESPNTIDAGQMSRKEVKPALVLARYRWCSMPIRACPP